MGTDFALGRREENWRSFLTPLKAYRTVTTADVGGPGPLAAVSGDPEMSLPNIIHLEARTGEVSRDTLGDISDFGRSSYLLLFVGLENQVAEKVQSGLLGAGDRADILVWVWCGAPGDVFVSAASDLNDNSKWHLLHSQSVTCSTVIRLPDVPALPMVVTVPVLAAAAGDVTISYRRNE